LLRFESIDGLPFGFDQDIDDGLEVDVVKAA
jgi:hypothetical protein